MQNDLKKREMKTEHTSSKKSKKRSKTSLGVNRLYELAFAQKQVEVTNLHPKPMTDQNSKRIVDQQFIDATKRIFNELDSNEDGLVSARRIQINSIPPAIIEIIGPLLIEVEESSLEIDFNMFLHAMKQIFHDLSILEKRKYINVWKTKKQSIYLGEAAEECTFHVTTKLT